MSSDVAAGGSLSARLGFPETAVEVGFSHPGVRHVMTAAGGTASSLARGRRPTRGSWSGWGRSGG